MNNDASPEPPGAPRSDPPRDSPGAPLAGRPDEPPRASPGESVRPPGASPRVSPPAPPGGPPGASAGGSPREPSRDRPQAPPPFVSVKFDPVGRVRRFLLDGVEFESPPRPGDAVVVAQGGQRAYATVTRTVPQIADRVAPPASSPDRVLRRATRQDVTARLRHRRREREVHNLCAMKISEHRLPMKLVRTEQQVDRAHIVFYFTADSRVDFRELVRDLAGEFRCRIEMRQIGARDEAKMLGGYGTCGRPLCCTTWLQGFEPITIKMAKRQQLSLSPSRLSGLCGRLKCCLRYELPNAAGEQFAGCAHEGSCSRSAGGSTAGGSGGGCGSGGCGSGGCGSGGCGSGGCGARGSD